MGHVQNSTVTSYFAGKDMTYLSDNAVSDTQLQPQKMHSLDKQDKTVTLLFVVEEYNIHLTTRK